MRVLVTGASGHVGGAVARRLIAAGHEVVAAGRRGLEIAGLERRHELDLAASGDIPAGLAGERCEAVVHAAAAIDLGPEPERVEAVNRSGTERVLALAESWDAERFVFISSLQVVGLPRSLPVDEEHPTAPPTTYHDSKLYGEQLVAGAAAGGISAASLRLTSPVGPATPDDGRIFSAFVRAARAGDTLTVAGRGTRAQDYVDTRDVATAVEACLERDVSGVLNIGSGRAVTNLELAHACVATLGSASEVELGEAPAPDDDLRWEISIERAREQLGYEPEHSLEDSIRAAAETSSAAAR